MPENVMKDLLFEFWLFNKNENYIDFFCLKLFDQESTNCWQYLQNKNLFLTIFHVSTYWLLWTVVSCVVKWLAVFWDNDAQRKYECKCQTRWAKWLGAFKVCCKNTFKFWMFIEAKMKNKKLFCFVSLCFSKITFGLRAYEIHCRFQNNANLFGYLFANFITFDIVSTENSKTNILKVLITDFEFNHAKLFRIQ